MPSIFSLLEKFRPASYVLQSILFSAVGIGLLVGFILLRRAYRRRFFNRLNARTLFYRQHWGDLLNGNIPAHRWRSNQLDCQIVESILLGYLDSANSAELTRLASFLRSTGLIEARILAARKLRHWRRRDALLSLGRMRVPQVIPALESALSDPSPETRLAAVRGLGRVRLPEAAEPILQGLLQGLPDVVVPALQDALLRCCPSDPGMLLPYIREAGDSVRPILVRVLAELVSGQFDEDLARLATDKLAEVRAGAARALSHSDSLTALHTLARLVEDPEWFVRLRAVAAIGAMRDPRSIPILISALSDEHRLLRMRAAEALTQFAAQFPEILQKVIAAGDPYGLQAYVSQLERIGAVTALIDSLDRSEPDAHARAILEDLVRSGTHRIFLDALAHHAQPRVRRAVASLLARSADKSILPKLQELATGPEPPCEPQVVAWTLQHFDPVAPEKEENPKVSA